MGKSRKTHRRRNLTNKKHRRNLTNKKHRRNLTNKKHHNNRCIAGGVSGTYKTKNEPQPLSKVPIQGKNLTAKSRKTRQLKKTNINHHPPISENDYNLSFYLAVNYNVDIINALFSDYNLLPNKMISKHVVEPNFDQMYAINPKNVKLIEFSPADYSSPPYSYQNSYAVLKYCNTHPPGRYSLSRLSSFIFTRDRVSCDNLFYEYIVGHFFINNYLNKLCCFVKTYDYYYTPESIIAKKITDLIQYIPPPDPETFFDIGFDTEIECIPNNTQAILIQWLSSTTNEKSSISSSKSLQYYLESPDSARFIEEELVNVLLQVYIPLAMLDDTFTHYDLHIGNIQLMEINGDDISHINYEYIYKGNTISFKSRYIVKIIDYGRSYFWLNERINSKAIYDNLMKKSGYPFYECGLNWLEEKGEALLSCSRPNTSYDLVALYHAMEYVMAKNPSRNDNRFFNTIVKNLPWVLNKYSGALRFMKLFMTFSKVLPKDLNKPSNVLTDYLNKTSNEGYKQDMKEDIDTKNEKRAEEGMPILSDNTIYDIHNCVEALISMLPNPPEPSIQSNMILRSQL